MRPVGLNVHGVSALQRHETARPGQRPRAFVALRAGGVPVGKTTQRLRINTTV